MSAVEVEEGKEWISIDIIIPGVLSLTPLLVCTYKTVTSTDLAILSILSSFVCFVSFTMASIVLTINKNVHFFMTLSIVLQELIRYGFISAVLKYNNIDSTSSVFMIRKSRQQMALSAGIGWAVFHYIILYYSSILGSNACAYTIQSTLALAVALLDIAFMIVGFYTIDSRNAALVNWFGIYVIRLICGYAVRLYNSNCLVSTIVLYTTILPIVGVFSYKKFLVLS